MPKAGVEWVTHNEVLSFEEATRLARVLASLGTKRFKITGGEPLLRRGVVPFIADVANIPGVESVTLTTNAIALEAALPTLLNAGLSAVNVSLDALDPTTYQRITGVDGAKAVHSALEALLATPLRVKINCVPIAGINESQLVPLARLSQHHKIAVRFIELMPLGMGAQYAALGEDQVRAILEKDLGPLTPYTDKLGEGPAVYYRAEGFAGYIGFISALSHKFCERCNRLRLTSTGLLKPCLSSNLSVDLRALLRNGANDATLAKAIQSAVLNKPAAHDFIVANHINNHNTTFMSAIGG
jgi:cyclic pyranopterin phosphate synthase